MRAHSQKASRSQAEIQPTAGFRVRFNSLGTSSGTEGLAGRTCVLQIISIFRGHTSGANPDKIGEFLQRLIHCRLPNYPAEFRVPFFLKEGSPREGGRPLKDVALVQNVQPLR